ncbi:MarR family winged helix-turn-helix transcriptional regulator [Chitinophagaceae bacterium MMS25-I14]
MKKTKLDVTETFARTVITVNLGFRQFMQAKFKQHDIDLTFEMLQVMACLWNEEGINQQEIARITVKDKASMTYLIDNLTRRKLLYRQEDGKDRRSKLIFLTEDGKKLQQTIRPWVLEMYEIAAASVSVTELTNCIQLLEKIKANVSPE